MKINLDELLKVAHENKDALKKRPKGSASDVYRFALALKITNGKHQVKQPFVYKAYKMWSAKPVSSKAFSYQFGDLFKRKKNYYLLNYRPIELLNKIDNMNIKI